jgi:hypothetical protein
VNSWLTSYPQLAVNVLNLVANIAGFRTLWLTAAPPPKATVDSKLDEATALDSEPREPVSLDAGLDKI